MPEPNLYELIPEPASGTKIMGLGSHTLVSWALWEK
jgi:hypothetical protein